MKNLIAIAALILFSNLLYADIEKEIREIEQIERNAVLTKDVATLEKLWAKSFTVNSPVNTIVLGRDEVIDLVNHGRINYTEFTREIEHLIMDDHMVITMGNETVVPVATGEAVKRRYTNVWMQENGEWKLIVRHANIICN
jgi:hypothetical protein